MADRNTNAGEAPAKSLGIPLITGLLLALVSSSGGFYAVYSGHFLHSESVASGGSVPADDGRLKTVRVPDVAYVPIDPLVISLGDGISGRHLRFRAELEVEPAYRSDVEKMMPRVVDVLNSYLRALELGDLTDSAALLRLRTQMLRRVQVVTGGGRINDLLIMEFVLN